MKNQLSRLIALVVLLSGLMATDNGWANFSGSVSRIPNPESSGGWLGDATVGSWNGSAYTQGWTYARFDAPDDIGISLTYWNNGWYNGGGENLIGYGASQEAYWVREYYWDGSVYTAGQSRVQKWDQSALASGDID